MTDHAGIAQRRLLSLSGDPFVFADWEQVVFLHFLIAPELLEPHVPRPLQLELFEGEACVSLVAVTLRNFRPRRWVTPAQLFRLIAQQRFLNLRTYVRVGNEPGALFLWGWLSRPFAAPLPSEFLGLPYAFASFDYDHQVQSGPLRGVVSAGNPQASLAYLATCSPAASFEPCRPGSLAEFAMERYSGFFCRSAEPRVFRAWHPPWVQCPVDATIVDASLVTNKFPWFKQARLAGGNLAPGFPNVWLGQPHRLQKACSVPRPRRVLSSFYKMP